MSAAGLHSALGVMPALRYILIVYDAITAHQLQKFPEPVRIAIRLNLSLLAPAPRDWNKC